MHLLNNYQLVMSTIEQVSHKSKNVYTSTES